MMAFLNHFYLYWTFTLTLSVGSESRGVAWTDFDEEAWFFAGDDARVFSVCVHLGDLRISVDRWPRSRLHQDTTLFLALIQSLPPC